MNTDFCTSRTHRLLYSGYPLEITTFDDITEDVSTPAWYLHEEIEFQYILNGQVSITCGERCFTASRGDIVFINQLAKHASVPAGSETAAVCSIIVHPSFILGDNQPELEAKYLHPILANNAYACLHIDHSAVLYPQFHSLLSQLITLNATQSTGYELLSKSCILQLWKLIYDMLSDSSATEYNISSHSTNLDDQRVRQAILYIRKHFMEPVTLDDIADSILVSKSECCRCFKRAIGMSPFEYLMKYRIEESTRRMRINPHESVSEIAGCVGFNNTSYYNKIFKKFMGCTPTEYRKSLT